MINVKLLKAKLDAEVVVRDVKLHLAHKELVNYAAWKSLPENANNKSAMEKILSGLKLEDEEWLLKEEELMNLENDLKVLNLIINTLNTTMEVMSRHSDIDMKYFKELESEYIKTLLGSI